ncbi:mannose-6-phosphate isomerase, class I [Microbacterium sp. JZ37]|uniref:mannose-6-phosphate isomerase, class I n=1 Tax=Microbacterium sp. JZ37 TaxID=2654193 RepID=UPI002B4AA252|nr:mannose-6-phosphate isomerase, class I [Microbacterium sp. JZ37]WRH16928.1 mannose-6-phosphate isomerase, class I [Microbacterium sp. JZ37]
MLVPLTNVPRDYAWGSRSLLAALEGREPAEGPEAEVWFGDHPSDPADLADGSGRTLDAWIADNGVHVSPTGRLPYLLKLLAAGSPLSIQVHPTKAQAEEGFAREASLDADAPRNYVDDNHKPEIIVALSDRFEALCGLRDLDATRRLLDAIGPAAAPLRDRLVDAEGLRQALGWLLGGEAGETVSEIIGALDEAQSTEFAAELANARRVASIYPGDPGVVVALLMNYVLLRRGEGLFLGAGQLHAYVSGLGVELMAASDNVLRGGLTPKRIDVDELLAVVDPTPGEVPVVLPVAVDHGSRGVEAFPVPVADFRLLRVRAGEDEEASLRPAGPAIVLATAGAVTVSDGGDAVELVPGRALFATPDTAQLRFDGDGEVFVAEPGAAA